MAYGRAEQEAVAAVVRPSPGNLLSAKPNRFCPSDHRYHHERSVPTDGITAAIKAATKSLRRNGHQLHQTTPQTKYPAGKDLRKTTRNYVLFSVTGCLGSRGKKFRHSM